MFGTLVRFECRAVLAEEVFGGGSPGWEDDVVDAFTGLEVSELQAHGVDEEVEAIRVEKFRDEFFDVAGVREDGFVGIVDGMEEAIRDIEFPCRWK